MRPVRTNFELYVHCKGPKPLVATFFEPQVRPMGLLPFFLNPVSNSRNRGSSTNRNPQKTCHVFSCHDIPALPLRQQFPMPIDQFYIYLPQSNPNETFAPQVAFRAASGGVVTLAANLGCQEPRTSRMSSQAERSGHPG